MLYCRMCSSTWYYSLLIVTLYILSTIITSYTASSGSERSSASEGQHYQRQEEARAINLSLSALGNCISALSEGRPHVPYRDSKLTRLLQGCLGGGSRTSILLNIPIHASQAGEILAALRFGARAKRIKVAANVTRCDYIGIAYAVWAYYIYHRHTIYFRGLKYTVYCVLSIL